ncbi:golgin subfamily B member 1 isoform X1 [Quillaja saponaria]|uniref:Golgin subfamily B member 1 isoform X1 n=1 Tax=Quillaja saponaria TaxID=32244 RepID=A0AAD7Q7F6_QUISA|nr:golgin subfamily B member 1 isoform X1 [Quillaja saponaria]
MKKLFFFRPSMSSNGNNDSVPPRSMDKKFYGMNSPESGHNCQAGGKSENKFRSPRGMFSKSWKPISDSQSSSTCPGLRRSRSLSSAAFPGVENGLINLSDQSRQPRVKDQTRSPSSSISSDPQYKFEHSSRCSTPNSERQYNPTRIEDCCSQNARQLERPGSAFSSRAHNDLSGNSSTSSSNISSTIVDRYIDGEQQQEKGRARNSSQKNYTENGNFGNRLPPKIQYTAPNSPADGGAKHKPRAHSFREVKGTHLCFSSRDWAENGFGHESPRRHAKNVIEKLSQSRPFPKSHLHDFDLDPTTVEDIYSRSLNGCFESDSGEVAQINYSVDEPFEITNGYHGVDNLRFQTQNVLHGGNYDGLSYDEIDENVDAELERRSKEAEERVMLLSGELEQERFFRDTGFDMPTMIHKIRNLLEERISSECEVLRLLQSRIAERGSAKEELECAKADFESRTRRLEKEKIELQSGLEKELDRRSSDWSLKLDKYQFEEQRLRERVRELAEQNVSLQREVSSFNEMEAESRSIITHSEQQLKEMISKMNEVREENQDLHKQISEVQDKYKMEKENRDRLQRNYEEKEKECKELHKSISRLIRTCSEQQKTINGLREGFSEELQKNQSVEKIDKHLVKLQMEQMRLTGVELMLRRELENYEVKVDSLRLENINLLKDNGKENVAATFKLDKELVMRVCCLQNQGVTMLNESIHLCSKLLEFIKGKAGRQQGLEVIENGLDGQFVIESDVRIQGLKRGVDGLTRSLQMMSSLLHEKSSQMASEFQSQCGDADKIAKLNYQSSEDIIRNELKAESLLTSLLREKLYSKELEVEQLQAELATAVRGNDILRCEVQNALDKLSCVTNNLKDLELEISKKDENINRLQSDLQESRKESTIMRGILPKVSEERDLIWEEVKQYSEKNKLLNSEVYALKKKIDILDEDILLKEGQITILKDSLGKKPFDLLASPDSMHEFLLD